MVPYLEKNFEPLEWSHCVVSIDVCIMNHGTKVCDKEGYDIIPIWMVGVINGDLAKEEPRAKERFHHKEMYHQPNIMFLSMNIDEDGENLYVQPSTINLDLVTSTH